MSVKQLIKENEGLSLKPYYCTEGKLTIGYGRNLEDRGITTEEAEYLLRNDLRECVADLEKLTFWSKLNEARQAVLFDMRFQLGLGGLMGFKNMLAALEREDYEAAAVELMDSRYAQQTPNRAKRNRDILRGTNEG